MGSDAEGTAKPCADGATYVSQNWKHKDLLTVGDKIQKLQVPSVSQHCPNSTDGRHESELPETYFHGEDALCAQSFCLRPDGSEANREVLLMPRAGPRRWLHRDPQDVKAAIVNCGGLCPGLNAVIRELVIMLYRYGCNSVRGVVGGYKGVIEPSNWIQLTPELVMTVHTRGGTVLASDRGNPPHVEMAEALHREGINQLYVIGGDGSQKGAWQIHEQVERLGYDIAIAGVPKTIDNDIALLDVTFGFHTAVGEAQRAIDAAYTEACGNANCLGIVKLMGRHAGFIALHASLAARHVDLCLVPEMEINLEECLDYIFEVQCRKRRGVVVVIAEGLGDTLLQSNGHDAGGNKKIPDVGPWFKQQVENRFAHEDVPLSVKYIDPSYMIRAANPDTFDSVYCATLAQNAVHGAMAGHTGFCVGQVDGNQVMLPIPSVTMRPPKRVDVCGEDFARLLFMTRQPSARPRARLSKPFFSDDAQRNLQSRLEATATFDDLTPQRDAVQRLTVHNLSASWPSEELPSPLCSSTRSRCPDVFQREENWCTNAMRFGGRVRNHVQMLEANPRQTLFWQPQRVKAVILNVGHACPGVNSVIRELVMMLHQYGCQNVWGVHDGLMGVTEPTAWLRLTPDSVEESHIAGSSILRTGQGNPPHAEMAHIFSQELVSQVYVIGGFGSHKGALQIYDQLADCISICAIPKTIDNDFALLDCTFGHNTAVAEARRVIDAAYAEACAHRDVVGVVKLMGRYAGFVALHATLAARHVDVCLLPEMDVDLEVCLRHISELREKRVNSGVVVVIAEGLSSKWQQCKVSDDGDVGLWFKRQLQAYFEEQKIHARVHYIDPSYMIRSTFPDPVDSIYCTALAQNAVHAAMAGYTAYSVGKVDSRYVLLPIQELVARNRQSVNVRGSLFARLMCTTGQPAAAAGASRVALQANGNRQRKPGRHVAMPAFGLHVARFLRGRHAASGIKDMLCARNQQLRLDGPFKPRHGKPLVGRTLLLNY